MSHSLRWVDGRYSRRPQIGWIRVFRDWRPTGKKVGSEYDTYYTGKWVATAYHRPTRSLRECRHQAIARDAQKALRRLELDLLDKHPTLNLVLRMDP